MKRLILITSICICLAMGMVLNNCGYKLSGFSQQIPDHIETIIIPDDPGESKLKHLRPLPK